MDVSLDIRRVLLRSAAVDVAIVVPTTETRTPDNPARVLESVTCPATTLVPWATAVLATAGDSPSRTNPKVRMERTNQRLSVIHFPLLLRFSGPTTRLRDRRDGAAGGTSEFYDIREILPQGGNSRKGAACQRRSP